MSVELVVRFAFAIAFDALAFIVWDVGTRPPVKLVRDIFIGLQRPAVLARGLMRLAVGVALLALAFLVARPGFVSTQAFMLIESGMVVAGLIVENLIGPDLRSRAHRIALPR